MSLLSDKIASLPSIIGGAVSSTTTAVSFGVANAATKVTEALGSAVSTFGSNNPFTKVTANIPVPGITEDLKAAKELAANSQELITKFDNLIALSTTSLADPSITPERREYLERLQASGKAGKSIGEKDLAAANATISKAKEAATTSGESPSAKSLKEATGAGQAANSNHMVILEEVRDTTEYVQFVVLPVITESRNVEYEAVMPPQFPGAFQKYKGTASAQWTMDVTFISRNRNEANTNYNNLCQLRGWTMPFYGENTAKSFKGQLGAPPPVLNLRGLRTLIGPVPVVITSLNWSWPKDVDYISTLTPAEDGKMIPFPAIMTIAIQLIESFSTGQINRFSLQDFRDGNLEKAYNKQL